MWSSFPWELLRAAAIFRASPRQREPASAAGNAVHAVRACRHVLFTMEIRLSKKFIIVK
jgi:hypothetical protein